MDQVSVVYEVRNAIFYNRIPLKNPSEMFLFLSLLVLSE